MLILQGGLSPAQEKTLLCKGKRGLESRLKKVQGIWRLLYELNKGKEDNVSNYGKFGKFI